MGKERKRMNVSNALLVEFFEDMLLIRKFEETLYNLAQQGKVHGSVHLCVGEEAPPVGVSASLTQEDYILPTHRGHGQVLAKGVTAKQLLAEILGRETGICKGRVGSMHLYDTTTNILGSNGIVGAQFPMSVGIGLGIALQDLKRCLVCYFGDGASNQGNFYEALNMASLWNLPIIYLCINNLYGMGTHYDKTSKVAVYEKARMFKMYADTVDGNDVAAVHAKMVEIVEMVKTERKPALLECYSYRISGHSAFDARPYRPKEEIEAWKKMDPIMRLETKLLENKVETAVLEEIKTRVAQTIAEAEKYALESPFTTFDMTLEQ
jgi:TPP-dependent pyruvate/acetoin dehydrogenase alpha subunit